VSTARTFIGVDYANYDAPTVVMFEELHDGSYKLLRELPEVDELTDMAEQFRRWWDALEVE